MIILWVSIVLSAISVVSSFWLGVTSFLGLHIISVVLATVALWSMSKRDEEKLKYSFLWLPLFLLFLPLIAHLLLLLFVQRSRFFTFDGEVPEDVREKQKVVRDFDFPSLQSTDVNQQSQRLNALTTNDYLGLLMSSRDLQGKHSIFLLKDALTSKIENTRLLAYALYAKKEQQLVNELERLMGLLKESNYKSARLHLAVAQFYQHLLEINLLEQDVALDTLKKIEAHAAMVIKLSPQTWQAYTILADINKQTGKLAIAEVLLRKALKRGAPPTLVKNQLQAISFDLARA